MGWTLSELKQYMFVGICLYVRSIYYLVLIKAGFKGSSVFQFELHLVDSWVSREIPAWEGWIEKHLIKLTMWHFWRRKEHLRRVNRHLECKCCELLQPSPGQPRIATTAAKSSKIPNLIGPIKKRNNYLYIELRSLVTTNSVKSILCSAAVPLTSYPFPPLLLIFMFCW